jgi:hypothetical protein
VARSPRPTAGELSRVAGFRAVNEGTHPVPEGAETCRPVRADAATGFLRISREFGSARRLRRRSPDCHGKEGVAGSSPAEGFRNRATARFPHFRSGSYDHFRTLPGEKGSSMPDDGRCTAVCASAQHVLLWPKVLTRYMPGGISFATVPGIPNGLGPRPRVRPARAQPSLLPIEARGRDALAVDTRGAARAHSRSTTATRAAASYCTRSPVSGRKVTW